MKDEKQESEVSTEEKKKKNFHLKELVAAGMLVFWAYVCVWNQEDYNVEA